MPLNLNQSNVTTEAAFEPMLTDLQANILKGHGRDFGHHVFLNFDPEKIALAKQWIHDFAKDKITSGLKQIQKRKAHKTMRADGGPVFTCSISATGYKALGINDLPVEVAQSPIAGLTHPAFQNGLKGSASLLKDKINEWDNPFRGSVDAMIMIADDNADKAKFLADGLVNEIAAFGTVLLQQKGHILHRTDFFGEENHDKINIEHFGYADGVSQPLYLADEIEQQKDNNIWSDAEPLSLVLVKDPNGKTENSFGSFMVFRKLEQNVKAFNAAEDGPDKKTALPQVKDNDGFLNADLAGAMVVGRFENGNVVVNSMGLTGTITRQSQITNNFDYSKDAAGSKCPFFAHTRITNPRDGVGDFAHKVRLTRRAMPYDDIRGGRFGIENLTDPTKQQLDDNQPTDKVGLLFMCYQAHINAQFEFIQSVWVNEGNIGGHLIAQDAVIGQGPTPAVKAELPEQWGNTGIQQPIKFGDFVTMKGGEYFFTPSISSLLALGV